MWKKRRSYHHGRLRQALLDAAVARLLEDESAAVSLRALAADVGVSPMAVYRHFADVDSLLAALAVRGFQMLAEHLSSVQGRGRARVEKLGAG
jgi:AcrR family transcriptional regulator